MIKLIASDVDGTLLPEGTTKVNPELYTVIRALKEKGVIFAAASGRQYASIREVFIPIENDMIFIAENGGYVVCRGQEIEHECFERSLYEEIVAYMRAQEGCFSIVNTADAAYTDSKDLAMIERLRNGYKINMVQVEDVLKLQEPIIKTAMYCTKDAAEMAAPAIETFKGRAIALASGERWVDFMQIGVDKGTALARIQKQLNIKVEETMAFGDNHNDIGMMHQAGESYAVANARESVKRAAKHIAGSNEEEGVLTEMKKLLASMENGEE